MLLSSFSQGPWLCALDGGQSRNRELCKSLQVIACPLVFRWMLLTVECVLLLFNDSFNHQNLGRAPPYALVDSKRWTRGKKMWLLSPKWAVVQLLFFKPNLENWAFTQDEHILKRVMHNISFLFTSLLTGSCPCTSSYLVKCVLLIAWKVVLLVAKL